MRLTRRQFLSAVPLTASALALGACGNHGKSDEDSAPQVDAAALSRSELEALSGSSASLLAWSAYWDCADDIDTIRSCPDSIDELSAFAASWVDGQVQVPDAALAFLRKARNDDRTAQKRVYLSFVNDVESSGSSIEKDTGVLWDVLGDDASLAAHVDELVGLATTNSFDGIEVDYEKIRSDFDLWDRFLTFERALLERCGQEGLALRVVLEPSTPVDRLTFPEGAEHSVMCYNLRGSGTEPGPKADFEFVDGLKQKFASVPGLRFALANGGYDWSGPATAKSLTRATAELLAAGNGTEPSRDGASGALSFSYVDSGTSHTVWYADEATLASWAERLQGDDGGLPSIDLWRL